MIGRAPGGLKRALAEAWFASGLYGATLGGRRVHRLEPLGLDLWPGDAEAGAEIVGGVFRFAGQSFEGEAAGWLPPSASPDWIAALHGFDWLRDLRAQGGEAARRRAQASVRDWIATQARWRPIPWRVDVLAQRLANWIANAEFLAGPDEPELARALAVSLARQARHLRRLLGLAAGADRLLALRSLVLAALCLPGPPRRTERLLETLSAELEAQILPDGGHVERSPRLQLAVLQALVELRAGLRARGLEPPLALQTAIDRAAPMLRFWRHGDGGLALFNDTNEGRSWLIDVALARAGSRGKPLTEAPQTGFQRVGVARALLIMDTGAPPPPGLDMHAHAGTLSFELSAGRERLITNCGAYSGSNADWRRAQRTTAAHSTVTVDDLSSSEVKDGARLGRRPRTVLCERKEAGGNIWIEASHDGFARAGGIVHRRRLYLAASGGDLRGEDTLSGRGRHRFAVRFHLHPDVQASAVQDGSAILLRLPSGGGWRLRASGGAMTLAESVYLGATGDIRRTEQVVISGRIEGGEAQVKWALTRLSSRE